MISRLSYIQQIIPFIDKPFIKILSGIRRSGKSVLLMQLVEALKKRGVKNENILYINFESFQYSHLNTAKALYEYISTFIKTNKRYYIFFDEIQEVDAWEKAVNSLQVDYNTDIYITGSNSKLLSSEIATYLSGRYVLFTIYTLSFKEYLQFKKAYSRKPVADIYDEFLHYLKWGAFPIVHTSDYTQEQAYKIVFDIYSSVLLRDVIQRYKFRDIELLERVIKFVFENIGNTFSAKKVADYFKSQQRKLDLNTVYNYLNALESSYIIHRIQRYNVKGKEILKTNEKYFVNDLSLIYALMGYRESMISGFLENLVALELLRRGYKVYAGKLNNLEIDFVAEKGTEKKYIQVSYKMIEKQTLEREYKPLLKTADNYPKYIITMDKTWNETIKGIKHMHIADFLLSDF